MDHQLKIKSYTPDAATYAPRISSDQWNQYKPLLKHLHEEGYKRAAMLAVLQKQGFKPTMGQLNAKMTAWGFKVYGTHTDTQDGDTNIALRDLRPESSTTLSASKDQDDHHEGSASRLSISSMTLCESDMDWSNLTPDNAVLTLDDVITLHSLGLTGSYWPSLKPSDFGFRRPSPATHPDAPHYQQVMAVADFMCAVHCFEQAFDLYFYVLEHLVAQSVTHDSSVVQVLIHCAISATADAQCTYVLPIIREAHSYCVNHGLAELASCFAFLSQDLCTPVHQGTDVVKDFGSDTSDYVPLLVAMNPREDSPATQREQLKRKLQHCDETCDTLAHLSLWSQDVLSYFRVQDQIIGKTSHTTNNSDGVYTFEPGLEFVTRALVIDYLNSPGPSVQKADVECQDDSCLFRSTLRPITSLIVMAQLLYEPLRLQSQSTTNEYLYFRAQQFAAIGTTTPLQELTAFASADKTTRCNAFVDAYIKHFNTTLAFRRFVSRARHFWDKMSAAKRLTQLVQNNQGRLLPHAGLPASRRSILRAMAEPFGIDSTSTDSRPSMVSENGSMGEFKQLASRIDNATQAAGSITPSDAMSIDTQSSWSFHRVTGFSQGPFSTRNSVSSRKVEHDEVDEYRQFMKDNNYSSPNSQTYSGTPAPKFSTRDKKDT